MPASPSMIKADQSGQSTLEIPRPGPENLLAAPSFVSLSDVHPAYDTGL